jgi:hypothetical protein
LVQLAPDAGLAIFSVPFTELKVRLTRALCNGARRVSPSV